MGRTPTKQGVWQKLKNLKFFRTSATEPETTGVIHGNMSDLRVPWTRSYTRRNVERDINDMDETDGIVGTALDKIADFATCFEDDNLFGFKIRPSQTVTGGKPSKEELEAIEMLNTTADEAGMLGMSCWDLIRDMVKKGNVFTENIFDSNYNLAKVVQFPNSWEIEKNVDKSGNLKSGNPDEAMRDPRKANDVAYVQYGENGKILGAFWPYQVTHWKFGHSSGRPYAEPMLGRAIRDWKKTRAQEDSLAVARITRAWDSNLHKILIPVGASQAEVDGKIEEYRNQVERDSITTYDEDSANFMTQYRTSPLDVTKDYYVPSYFTQDGKVIEGGIERLKPSTAELDSINDIYWGITRLLVALSMPMDYIGLKVGQKSFIDKASEKGLEAFSRMVLRLQYSHAYSVKQIMDMQLLLSGYDPRQINYDIVYPTIIPQSAEMSAKIILNKSQAAQYWANMGIPAELVGKTLLNLDPEAIALWRTELQKQIKATQPVAPVVANPSQPNRSKPTPNKQEK